MSLRIGQIVNGYTVQTVINSHTDGYAPDGAYLLGYTDRAPHRYVVAYVTQAQLNSADPVKSWSSGDYTNDPGYAARRILSATNLGVLAGLTATVAS